MLKEKKILHKRWCFKGFPTLKKAEIARVLHCDNFLYVFDIAN